MYDRLARENFTRALRKAFWQKVQSWISGKTNSLLPYDQVRDAIPIKGQRYRGLQSIPIDKIVGSLGRYHEFNRAFLPTQRHTEQRWVNIGRAMYEDITLPPIDVLKLGEVYFVKDGNHRVSAGKELGREFIDAYVTEIDIPVSLTPDTAIEDLETKRETAEFLSKTGLLDLYPDSGIELTLRGEVSRLFEHVETHRYYLGMQEERELEYEEAARSWYENVYLPLVREINKQELQSHFDGLTETDLYLLVSEYQWMLRNAYKTEADLKQANRKFTETLAQISPEAAGPAKQITRTLQNAPWLDAIILDQERSEFHKATSLDLEATVPGTYAKVLQHIHDHRWFLGIDKEREIAWQEAVDSWHENIYLALSVLIDELEILEKFPGRTKMDLYLWIIEHQQQLQESLNWEIPTDIAAQNLLRQKGAPTAEAPAVTDTRDHRTPLPALLFTNILVPVSDREEDLEALDQALLIAERNHGRIYGLHVISSKDEESEESHRRLARIFEERCSARGISGKIAFETGSVAQRIAERASWADLIVLSLNFPPASTGLAKMASGFRYVLRRSGRPVLAVPAGATPLQNILLAYDGSHLADEALYIATCLLAFWEDTSLTVITASQKEPSSEEALARAQAFLDSHHIKATYVQTAEKPAQAITEAANRIESDLIIMGGYGMTPLMDIAFGSTVDGVLQACVRPVLIRT